MYPLFKPFHEVAQVSQNTMWGKAVEHHEQDATSK